MAGTSPAMTEKKDKPMRMRVDHAADAVDLNLTDRPIKDSEEVADGIVVDYDEEGRIVGIEIRTPPSAPKNRRRSSNSASRRHRKITQDVRDYAATLNDQQQGMADMSKKFIDMGAEVCVDADKVRDSNKAL